VAVKANLGSGLAEIVIGVVTFITNTIEIMEKFIVFMRYKVSKLEVFGVAIAGKVRKSIEVIKQ
jgi:hypothetical protein